MANAVIMPKAGITVETCIIGEWVKKPGDTVAEGDVLFTYETDKASFECESTAAGTLLEIFYQNGDEVPCLINVCAIGNPGEDVSALRPADAPAAAPAAAEAAPAAPAPEAAPAASAAPAPAVAAAAVAADTVTGVSPRAKALAADSGTSLDGVSGTGPKGRVIERDIRRVMANGPDVVAAPAAVAAAPVDATEYEEVKFSGIRRSIAAGMMKSLSSMAQLTNHFSFDATDIKRCREKFKNIGGDLGGVTLGDIVLYAVSRVLLHHPDLNANMVEENKIRRFKHVNLGVAVDTDRGLMVPTIMAADTKSLVEISKEVKELAAACRSGSINPDLLKGASFTVSNLGAFGVECFTPVINPPQTGILGVCTTIDRVRATKGGMEIYPAMGLSLTYDHRAVDGGPASKFVKELSSVLTDFTSLLFSAL